MNSFQIIASIVIPLIAIITAIIAYQQFYINKVKLRHDLYERRAKIYREILRFIKMVIMKEEISYSNLAEFWSKVGEAEFIFDKKIVKFIGELYYNGVDFVASNEYLWGDRKVEGTEERKIYSDKIIELLEWFGGQLTITNTLFKDYMLLNETVTVNPNNKGYKRLIIIFGVLLSCIWLIYYSITFFKLDLLFNNVFLMYPLGVLLSFLIPYLIYKATFWMILGFQKK